MEGERIRYEELKQEEKINIEKQLEEHLDNNTKLKISFGTLAVHWPTGKRIIKESWRNWEEACFCTGWDNSQRES